MEVPVLAAVVAFVVVVLLVIVYLSIRVVQQYEKMVVFRLGRTNESMVREPGLRFLIPIIDRPVKVDLREQFIEVPSQTTITRDNAPINVDFLIYWRIVDPLKSVVNVVNFAGALQGVATTTLRAVIGDILLDDVLSKREQINEVLRVKLDEVTERWGGKVTTVEIREITPPRDVQDAMNRKLSAERTRRAVITESEGARQAAINVAEGQKQSEILKAEGERQAAILRAEGFSEALTRIFGAATGIDEKTMTLQYLEALKALGASPSTKFVIPIEFTRLLEPFVDYVNPASGDGGERSGGPSRPARPDRAAAGRPARRRDPASPARRGRGASFRSPRSMSGPVGAEPPPPRRAADDAGRGRPRTRRSTRSAARSSASDRATACACPGAGCRAGGRRRPEAGPADPHEAILLLHGWSGSVAPDLVEYGPFLRRTAGVLGLDFRGHGESDDAPTTFGLREVEDVAGALAWLGERGIERVALFGTSMGGITAIAAVVVLGDGSLAGADVDPDAPAHVAPPRRPRIVGGRRRFGRAGARRRGRLAGPGRRFRARGRRWLAGRLFDAVARTLGGDPRETEPIRMIGLLGARAAAADPGRGRRDGAACRRAAPGRRGAPTGTERWDGARGGPQRRPSRPIRGRTRRRTDEPPARGVPPSHARPTYNRRRRPTCQWTPRDSLED